MGQRLREDSATTCCYVGACNNSAAAASLQNMQGNIGSMQVEKTPGEGHSAGAAFGIKRLCLCCARSA